MTSRNTPINIKGTEYTVQVMTDDREPGTLYMAILPPIANMALYEEISQNLLNIIEEELSRQGLNTSFRFDKDQDHEIPFPKIFVQSAAFGEWQKGDDGEWDNDAIHNAALVAIGDKLDELREKLGVDVANDSVSWSERTASKKNADDRPNKENVAGKLESELRDAILSGFAEIPQVNVKDRIMVGAADQLARTMIRAFPNGPQVAWQSYGARTKENECLPPDPIYQWLKTEPQIGIIRRAIPLIASSYSDTPIPREGLVKFAIGGIRSKVDTAYAAHEEKIATRDR